MKLAPCPKCHKTMVKWFIDKHGNFGCQCYNPLCQYTLISEDYISRKIATYAWNRAYEIITGETLPDAMCGRQDGAFSKKEQMAGYSSDSIDGNGATYKRQQANREKTQSKRRRMRAYAAKQRKQQEASIQQEYQTEEE